MEAPRDAEPEPETQPQTLLALTAAEEVDEQQEDDEGDVLMVKVQELIEKITANSDNPSPNVLHAISTIIEAEEARYLEDADPAATNNGRFSHVIGRLGNLIQDNDEFFDLISMKFLTESRYSESVQAASARLLYSCSLNWTYPHDFEDEVLLKLQSWLMDESSRSSKSEHTSKHETGKQRASDSEMLRTYSTGLLAVCLSFGGKLVEDVLATGLPAKLIRYLRVRVLGEISSHQRDSNPLNDNKVAPTVVWPRTREEVRGKLRQVTEGSQREHDRDSSSFEDLDSCVSRQKCGDASWAGEETPDGMTLDVNSDDLEAYGEDKYDILESRGSKTKPSGRSSREEDIDENLRDESSRRKANRFTKTRGKGRYNEGISEAEQTLLSPSSVSGSGYLKDRSASRNQDSKRTAGGKKGLVGNISLIHERDDNDDCFQECKVGSKDITDLVKRAVRAAEEEARTVNASGEAIKAAGDAAAETVKTQALKEYERTNDEEAAVRAASIAASTIIDAPSAVALSRSSNTADSDTSNLKPTEAEDVDEYSILDNDSLAKEREKFCIQCLVMLGEYIEVLGPVLQGKGVDVCLALLQRSIKHREESSTVSLLPDILKLISALSAHRKFAALFVDRGGMQRLLLVPRNTSTFFPLSSCLFTIGSVQGIMERVCALSTNVVQEVVELALQLLECPRDHQARKNGALFFATAFVFKAVIDAFDVQDGLQKLLALLDSASSVRSGVPSGSLNNSGSDRSPAEVLTSIEKQVAFHTCVAVRQYFRAHFRAYVISIVDSVRPIKNVRNAPRNTSSARAAYKPLDISNEAMDTVFRQIQKDRKLGSALVRARWHVIDQFLNLNGHTIMLKLCQGPPVERYLQDTIQYALGVLHIVTFVPYSRMRIVNAPLSNDRVGISVILDAADGDDYVDPEVVEQALNLLINLVCPPPSISNKPTMESRDRNTERIIPERAVNLSSQSEPRERNGEPSVATTPSVANTLPSQSPASTVVSGLVGDRRISLGARSGCAGLAAQLEQGYRQAREAVRAHNGIRVLVQLLTHRMVNTPAALDCIRALTCRVLLGLARDDTIAHILTKLQVEKRLSKLIRDSGSQPTSSEQNRWQTELAQVTVELIGVVTNSGRASTLAASDAATPTLRRIERAAIAAATPVSYHPRELLLLMHEHLQASGLAESAATLLKEAQLTPLPPLAAPSLLAHQATGAETSSVQIQWPSGRAPCGFLLDNPKVSPHQEDSNLGSDLAVLSLKQKPFASSAGRSYNKMQSIIEGSPVPSNSKSNILSQKVSDFVGTPFKTDGDVDIFMRTPIILPMKRKSTDVKEVGPVSSAKRLNTGEHLTRTFNFMTPNSVRRSALPSDSKLFSTPSYTPKDVHGRSVLNVSADLDELQATPLQHGLLNDSQPPVYERPTLDSVIVQYLKHQHRQCAAPITTLPPLSLLHPHVCPEPRRSLDAPSNVTARLSSREFRSMYGGNHGSRKDRQFVYSRFRPWRTCRDDSSSLLTCISFLGGSARVAAGGHNGELKVFETDNGALMDTFTCHQSPLTHLESYFSGETQLLLSSSAKDVRLWDAFSVSNGPKHSFEDIKAARFSNSGSVFSAFRSNSTQREILLYDTQTCQLDLTLMDTSNSSSGRGHPYSLVHFSPSDSMLLWDGVLWDRRAAAPIHRFEQLTDYGGGGFHPAGNEVIINSEVWDLRKFRLLRNVPSLGHTVISFNASGDVIYAILRRNLEELMSAFNSRRMKHPLHSAFRTVDAVNYSDIATIPVDRCVLDFATEPTDSFVGLITMDSQDDMASSARVYEIGRRKPTDDDSDPDDAEDSEEEDEDEDDLDDDDSNLDMDLDDDDDSDGDDNDDDRSSDDENNGDFEDDDGQSDMEFYLGGGSDSDAIEIIGFNSDDDDDGEGGIDDYSSGDDDD